MTLTHYCKEISDMGEKQLPLKDKNDAKLVRDENSVVPPPFSTSNHVKYHVKIKI